MIFIAMSLDGYIAGPDGDISFLAKFENPGEDYGYSSFMESIDTVFLGRKTYDKILSIGFQYPDGLIDIYVITHSARPRIGNISFYTGSPNDLVNWLKTREGKNIFCDGGSEIVNELLRHNLIDELIISVIPTFLGDGIRLFQNGRPETNLRLVGTKEFDSGLVQLHYVRVAD